MTFEEKRVHLRKALQTEGWVADPLGNNWTAIQLLDISMGGIAFISEENMAVNSSRIFRFHLPGKDRQIDFIGRIANCNQHQYLAGYRVGAQFTRIDAMDLIIVERFVDHKASVST
ncbi:MAG: PilZ domain-containing protein [Burkholderiales bacterium]|nr:PilZ domain-containing protein [Burkholderiales bacterium]